MNENFVFAHTVRCLYIYNDIHIYFSVAAVVASSSSCLFYFFLFIYLLFPRHFIHETIHNDVCVCVLPILSSQSCWAVGTPTSPRLSSFDPFISSPNNNFFFASVFFSSLFVHHCSCSCYCCSCFCNSVERRKKAYSMLFSVCSVVFRYGYGIRLLMMM